MIELKLDQEWLRSLVQSVVSEALLATDDHRIAYTEAEAADMLGIRPWVLRDCRRRGEISGSRVGSKIVYTKADLSAFLSRQRDT